MRWVSRLKDHLKPPQATVGADDQISLLAVIPTRPDQEHLAGIAQRARWSLQLVSTLQQGREALQQAVKPVVICDRDLPDCDWKQALETLVAAAPGSVVLLATSTAEESLWEEVVRVGGYDVLRKPFDFEGVSHTVHFAWNYWKFTNGRVSVAKEKGKVPRPS